jgi:hypothetical protein
MHLPLGSGFRSFGEGFHLFAILVFVLRSESITVASSAIPPSQWRLGPNNRALIAKLVSSSHANGPNSRTDDLEISSFLHTRTTSLPIYLHDAKVCAT